jgi:alpha-tubulin suppressor-like RCC1 family protein
MIECGQYHSIVVSRDNEIYTWGKGYLGQLGNGKQDSKGVPVQISLYR